MSEWLKEHAWKACVGETLPWVRIPLSPPILVAPSRSATRQARNHEPSDAAHPKKHDPDSSSSNPGGAAAASARPSALRPRRHGDRPAVGGAALAVCDPVAS